eukprot:1146615-Prorocentrum_minimum.AAC.2
MPVARIQESAARRNKAAQRGASAFGCACDRSNDIGHQYKRESTPDPGLYFDPEDTFVSEAKLYSPRSGLVRKSLSTLWSRSKAERLFESQEQKVGASLLRQRVGLDRHQGFRTYGVYFCRTKLACSIFENKSTWAWARIARTSHWTNRMPQVCATFILVFTSHSNVRTLECTLRWDVPAHTRTIMHPQGRCGSTNPIARPHLPRAPRGSISLLIGALVAAARSHGGAGNDHHTTDDVENLVSPQSQLNAINLLAPHLIMLAHLSFPAADSPNRVLVPVHYHPGRFNLWCLRELASATSATLSSQPGALSEVVLFAGSLNVTPLECNLPGEPPALLRLKRNVINYKCPRFKVKDVVQHDKGFLTEPPETPVRGVNSPVRGVDSPVRGVNSPVRGVNSPVRGVNSPVRGVNLPVRGVNLPVRGVNSPVRGVSSPVRGE